MAPRGSDDDVDDDDDLIKELDEIWENKPEAKKQKPARKRLKRGTDKGSDSEYDEGGSSKKSTKSKKRRRQQQSDDSDRSTDADDDSDGGKSNSSDSDSESAKGDSDDEEEVDEYGSDFMGDEEDRRNLAQMTQLQRERILNERQEKREARLARLELKRTARGIREKEKKKDRKKEKRTTQAKSKRTTTKEQREKEKETDKRLTKRSAFSLADMDNDNSVEEDKPVSLTLADLRKAQVNRNMLMDWQWLPHFEETVRDCYVRVGIGQNYDKRVYRVAQISKVAEYHRVYKVEKSKTNRALELKIGTSKRTFTFAFISNTAITQAEFDIYIKALQQANLPIPSVRRLEALGEAITRVKDHKLTNEEFETMIAEKHKIQSRPRNFATEKTDLLRLLDLAQQEDQIEEVNRLRQELEELKEYSTQYLETRDKMLEKTAELNQRNRMKQMEIEQNWSLEKAKTQSIEVDTIQNPFARRRLKITSYKSKPKDAPASTIPATAAATTTASATASSPTLKAVNSDERTKDVFQVHRLMDIDLDLPNLDHAPPIPVASVLLGLSGSSSSSKSPSPVTTGRRSLNLSDFKAKKGIL